MNAVLREYADCTQPYSRAAAENVIGLQLLDPGCGGRARVRGLTAEHFQDAGHRAIYIAIGELIEASQPTDWESVSRYLDTMGQLKIAGGHSGLRKLATHTIVSPDSMEAWVDRLIEAAAQAPPPTSAAEQAANGSSAGPVSLADFYAYMPQHSYIFRPSREMWPASSVNARIPPVEISPKEFVKPASWLDQHRAVEQMTWAPGLPEVIDDRLISGGGWIKRPGCRTFNLYQPPAQFKGDAREAGPWRAHLERVFGAEAIHIARWLAHRVQRPDEKINHALLLGGGQGIGKDTILEPVKHAIGPWNFTEVSPLQLLGRFNSFVKSVILRMSEARDLGDIDRYGLYEHTKTLTAAPPDVLRVDEKNIREYAVMNVTGVVITTNHIDGIYLPPDDRRHFVAWSDRTKEGFPETYWRDLYRWYTKENGIGHVAAFLASLDLSDFDPKAPPPKTAAFWRVVDAGRAPEDAELADVLESLKNPAAVTVGMLSAYATDSFREWLADRRNSRQVPHRMEAAGYTAVRNDAATSGLWVVAGKRQVIYTRRELSIRDRMVAATRLCRDGR